MRSLRFQGSWVLGRIAFLVLVFTAACSLAPTESGSSRGGIGYYLQWEGHSTLLGTPAGQLEEPPPEVDLRVGEAVRLTPVNAATPSFSKDYVLTSDSATVSVSGAKLNARAVGSALIQVSRRDHRPPMLCTSNTKPSCPILDVHVVS